MAPSSEVSSIMEGMIFAFELCFLLQTAEIMTLERPEKYCGKIIHDPKWSSNSVLRNHPMSPKWRIAICIPLGPRWYSHRYLGRAESSGKVRKFSLQRLGGENHRDTMSALSWSRRFLLEMAAHSRTIPWWSGSLHPQGLNEPFIATILGWFTTTGDLCLGATSQPKWQLGSSTAVRWGQDLPRILPFFFRLQAVIDLGSYSTER